MKTHYDPYPSEHEQKPACGTWDFENTLTTRVWSKVDCKKCLQQRAKIEKAVTENEKVIIKQMGDMAHHFKTN